MRQGVKDSRTCVNHSRCRERGDTGGKQGAREGLRGNGGTRGGRGGRGCHQDTGERCQNEGRHVHGAEECGHILLERGSLDDTRNRAGSDQKNRDADDLRETEVRVRNQVADVSGYQNADQTAERKRNQRVHRNLSERAKGEEHNHSQRARKRLQGVRELFRRCRLEIVLRNAVARLLCEERSEDNGRDERAERRNQVLHHYSREVKLKSLGHGNGVRVRGDNVACLAAAYHCKQNAALRETGALTDCKGNRRNRDDSDVNEHADRADNHGRDRECRNGALFAYRVDDGLCDFLCRAGLNERARQNTAGQNAEHRGHHGARAAHHRGDRAREAAAANQSAD